MRFKIVYSKKVKSEIEYIEQSIYVFIHIIRGQLFDFQKIVTQVKLGII